MSEHDELQELRRLFTEDLVNIRSRLASLEERMDEVHEPSATEVRRAEKASAKAKAKARAKQERQAQKRPREKRRADRP